MSKLATEETTETKGFPLQIPSIQRSQQSGLFNAAVQAVISTHRCWNRREEQLNISNYTQRSLGSSLRAEYAQILAHFLAFSIFIALGISLPGAECGYSKSGCGAGVGSRGQQTEKGISHKTVLFSKVLQHSRSSGEHGVYLAGKVKSRLIRCLQSNICNMQGLSRSIHQCSRGELTMTERST